MESKQSVKFRVIATASVTLLVLGWLLWQYLNGGVQGHNLLSQKDLPFISNWWSGLLLPVLTWIFSGRVAKRLRLHGANTEGIKKEQTHTIVRFVLGLLMGILLAVSFTQGYQLFLDNVPWILLALGLLIPIFYAEFMLGFILGMTYTFGGVLPTVFIFVLASVGFLLYKFIRPLLLKVASAVGGKQKTQN